MNFIFISNIFTKILYYENLDLYGKALQPPGEASHETSYTVQDTHVLVLSMQTVILILVCMFVCLIINVNISTAVCWILSIATCINNIVLLVAVIINITKVIISHTKTPSV